MSSLPLGAGSAEATQTIGSCSGEDNAPPQRRVLQQLLEGLDGKSPPTPHGTSPKTGIPGGSAPPLPVVIAEAPPTPPEAAIAPSLKPIAPSAASTPILLPQHNIPQPVAVIERDGNGSELKTCLIPSYIDEHPFYREKLKMSANGGVGGGSTASPAQRMMPLLYIQPKQTNASAVTSSGGSISSPNMIQLTAPQLKLLSGGQSSPMLASCGGQTYVRIKQSGKGSGAELGGGGQKMIMQLSGTNKLPGSIILPNVTGTGQSKGTSLIMPRTTAMQSVILQPNKPRVSSAGTGFIYPSGGGGSVPLKKGVTISSPKSLIRPATSGSPTDVVKILNSAAVVAGKRNFASGGRTTSLLISSVNNRLPGMGGGSPVGSTNSAATPNSPAQLGTSSASPHLTSVITPNRVAASSPLAGKGLKHVTLLNGKVIAATAAVAAADTAGVREVVSKARDGLRAASTFGGAPPSLPPLQPISPGKAAVRQLKATGLALPDSTTVTAITENKPYAALMPSRQLDDIQVELMPQQPVEPKKEEPSRDVSVRPSAAANDKGAVDEEVTVRLLAPDDGSVSPKKAPPDDVHIEIVKPAATQAASGAPAKGAAPDDFDPSKALVWDGGVGSLPGSEFKFRMNEFGILEYINNDGQESKSEESSAATSSVATSSSDSPVAKRDSEVKEKGRIKDHLPKSNAANDKIYRCNSCGCYGLYTEFVDMLFCSVACKKIKLTRILLDKKREKTNELKSLRVRRRRRKREEARLKARQELEERLRREKAEQREWEERARQEELEMVGREDQERAAGAVESEDDKAIADRLKSFVLTDEMKADRLASFMSDEMKLEKEKRFKTWMKKMAEPDEVTNEVGEKQSPLTTKEIEMVIGVKMEDVKVELLEPEKDDSPPTSENDLSMKSESSYASNSAGNAVKEKRPPKCNWLTESGEFVWNNYLKNCEMKAAPVKLFKDAFQSGKNGFKVGMKLEGIDPEHQSYFCVLTVVELKGCRIKLHFDGYPENYDFWCNVDSADIFPPGWCEKNNHRLQPPHGYTADTFSWTAYLKQCKAQPAPKSLFTKSSSTLCVNHFRTGMKLEAVDRKNSALVCVASVADIIDSRILVHFDSWGDVYDYWAEASSPYIHPVGWCKENGHQLTPPNNYKSTHSFSWDTYLRETKTTAAPSRAFKPPASCHWRRNTKLEAVDRRAPHLLRVATVRDLRACQQLFLAFDGFPDAFGYWVDADSPDLHPVGWAARTGHPLEMPPRLSCESHTCTTAGCRGDGHVKGTVFTTHTTVADCPYSATNMNSDAEHIPDRVSCVTTGTDEETSPTKIQPIDGNDETLEIDDGVGTAKEERIERRGRKRKASVEADPGRSDSLARLRREVIESVMRPGYCVRPGEGPRPWVRHSGTLGVRVDALDGGDPRAWSHHQVTTFLNPILPHHRTQVFHQQAIDGESLLLLSQSDLTDYLGLKLGPAIKVFNTIALLREKSDKIVSLK